MIRKKSVRTAIRTDYARERPPFTVYDPGPEGILPNFRRPVNKAPGEKWHFRKPALSLEGCKDRFQYLMSGNIGVRTSV